MAILTDLHTHTNLCDGKASPREMAEAAFRGGLHALGFSGHSFVEFDPECGMDPDTAARYRDAVAALKKEYDGRLTLFTGIEKDVYGAFDSSPYDYVIVSGHYVPLPGGGYLAADLSPEETENAIRTCFGGDPYRYAAAYYEGLAARALKEKRADIIGHFDLVTKFNEGGRLFREDDKRYMRAALDSLEAVFSLCSRFEINTGAMSRGWRSTPYIAPFLLRHLRALGGRVVLSSDSHSTSTLLYGFEDAAAYAKACGFTHADVLREDGFIPTKL